MIAPIPTPTKMYGNTFLNVETTCSLAYCIRSRFVRVGDSISTPPAARTNSSTSVSYTHLTRTSPSRPASTFTMRSQNCARLYGGVTVVNRFRRNIYLSLIHIYGSGDGKTTFNLPDMRGRVAVGSDANSPGAQCGETAHKLGISEIPSHSHPYSAYLYSTGAENGRINSQEGAGVKWADPTNTRNSGGGDNHNNMQPSLYLHHIIKI